MSTDHDWQAWGEKDPYYGVLNQERFRRGNIDGNLDEFFASGRADVERFLARFHRFFGTLPIDSALDFGCGVGRLSLALAEHFDHVVGVDVAPAMLAEARKNAARFGKKNVAFALSDDGLSNAPGQYDFVNSYIVLQHIPTSRGLPLIKQLVGKVKPGGGCMLHISVLRRASLARRAAYWVRYRAPLGNAAINLLRGRPLSTPGMQMNEYPLPVVLQIFQDAGMGETAIVTEDHSGTLTVAISARKCAPA